MNLGNKKALGKALEDLQIPQHMHGAVIRYIEKHIPPGDFLTAVIENDLQEAVSRADAHNQKALPAYVKLFYNYAPSGCWGYKGAVADWVKKGEKYESIPG